MKILHVYRTYYPDSKGGIQEAIRQICLSTKDYGVESKIFTLSPQCIPKILNFEEATVIRSKSQFAPASCDIGGPSAFVEFCKLTEWADIVHYHFPWPFLDVIKLLNPIKKPSVITYHSDIVKQKFLKIIYEPLMTITLQSMSAIIATSPNYVDSSAVLRKLLVKNKIKVIPLGIARPELKGLSQKTSSHEYLNRIGVRDKKYLLFLGVLRNYKGVHFLVQAAQSISGTIVIAGTGPEEKALIELAHLYKLNNLIFLGEVDDIQKNILISNCQALVLPSNLRSEAFGMVLVEASMYAKPMISCEVSSGTSFVNVHELTGLVIPPANPVALSEACNRLLIDNDLASRMGASAFKRYEKYFSSNALGKSHAELYAEILTNHAQ